MNFFALNFEDLYGILRLSYNLHNLVFHLCDDIERHGSSSFHTEFSLESVLGDITTKIRGNRGIPKQMISSKHKYWMN